MRLWTKLAARSAMVALTLGMAGCPKKQSTLPKTAPPPPQGSSQWRPPRLELLTELADLDDAMIKGDAERYLRHFSQDPSTLILGSGPNELYLGPQMFAETIRSGIGQRGGYVVRQTDAQAYASADGSGGFTYSEFDIMTWKDDKIYALPMRMTLVFDRGYDGKLKVIAGHTSIATADAELFARAQAGNPPPVTGIQERVGPNANELWSVVTQLLQGGFDAIRNATLPEATALIVGTAPGERWSGIDWAAQPSAQADAPPAFQTAYSAPHVFVGTRATFGFATYNVTLTGTVDGKPTSFTQRVTEVYDRTPAGWRRVHSHASVSVPPEDIGGKLVQR